MNLSDLFKQKSTQIWQCQTGNGEEHSAKRSRRKTSTEKVGKKKENYLIDYSLKPNWLFVTGCS